MTTTLGLVPAAGVGARMGAGRPKQYLPLGSSTLLQRSVASLLQDARVQRVLVVVAPEDQQALELPLPQGCEVAAVGGATRAETVRNGVQRLAQWAGEGAWALVHDAARPCLTQAELAGLLDAGGDDDGALLALPVADTVKREAGGRVARTEDRRGLWRALTPQYFRVGVLRRAFEHGAGAMDAITDESSAVEALGLKPRLVQGLATNIKVTDPGDLALAESILRSQGRW